MKRAELIILVAMALLLSGGLIIGTALCEEEAASSQGRNKETEIAGTGTIHGLLKSPWIRRYPAVVYIEDIKRFTCKMHPAAVSSSADKCAECGMDLVVGKFPLPDKNPVMDQKNLVFTPHILPIMVGTTVDFPNNDTVRHNVFSPPKCAKQFNLGTYGAGSTKPMTFETIGEVPLLCNVHTEMNAFIVVLPNPYFVMTDRKSSTFTIKNVPPGTYRVTFWHEKLASKSTEVMVKAGGTAEINFENLKKK